MNLACPTTVADLETLLSEPTTAAIDALRRHEGDLVLLGVAGKMGPTLARMTVQASRVAGTNRRVIGVARFSDPAVAQQLQSIGVETIAADLLEPGALEKLPDAPLVIYLAGRKFGSTGQESLTWAMNAWLPGRVAERYRNSRIVAFSTGNVYGTTPLSTGGSRESDPLQPVGEYAMSCLARERMFQYFSELHQTPICLLRLNYACELRYGVLVDLAQKVWTNQPIDLSMGAFNVLWQADANAAALAAFDWCDSPARLMNLTGPETLSVRRVCIEFGRLLDRQPHFVGTEAADALLNDASLGLDRTGYPRVSPERLMTWVASWLKGGLPLLGKPTHFENRAGQF